MNDVAESDRRRFQETSGLPVDLQKVRYLALQLGIPATALGHVFLPSLGRQVADGVQEVLTGFLQVEWHGETVLWVL
jgi:hypothetical protein